MNYYNEIKIKLIENENYARIKDYSKERYKVQTYFEVGRILSEAGSKYGENIIGKYALKLQNDIGKKYNERTLRSMRQFYNLFKDEIWKPMVSKLTWTHFLVLIPIKDKNKMNYYINQTIELHLTKRELIQKIKNEEYERLDESTKLKIINNEQLIIQDTVKNPIIIPNRYNRILITEKDLQNIILENIEQFLEELGESYCFIKSEYKIKIGNRYNYIDMLLYNIKYKCYVVIELKITEQKKEHIGQIVTYMHYIDDNLKTIEENNTLGIIICKKDNQFTMKYCGDPRVISREYKIYE